MSTVPCSPRWRHAPWLCLCGYEVFYSLQTRIGALVALHGFDRDTSSGAEFTTKNERSFTPVCQHSGNDPNFALRELSPFPTESLWWAGFEKNAFPRCGGGPRPPFAAGRPSAMRTQSPFRECGGNHQMEAAIGWLQKNSGRSQEGRES